MILSVLFPQALKLISSGTVILCVTVDYTTIEEKPSTVTIRDRDTTKQYRVPVADLYNIIEDLINNDADIGSVGEEVNTRKQ